MSPGAPPQDVYAAIKRHLVNFKKSASGRRGRNPVALNNDQWWALGQHYGLMTPLLDWTESPSVALFFAYTADKEMPPESSNRTVWAADEEAINQKSQELTYREKWQTVQFVRPDTDENIRLVSQRGLFSIGPSLGHIECWVKKHFKSRRIPVLIKLNVPDRDRERALKALNKMNVNHAWLFPDIQGAAWFCNLTLELSK